MAVAEDGAPPCSFYGSYNMLEEASPSPIQLGSLSSNPCSALYSLQQDHYHHSPPLSSSGSSHPQPDEPHSPNKTTTSFIGGSFLSFQSQNCYNFGHPRTLWDQDHSHQNILVDAAGGGDWLYGDGAARLVAHHQSPPPLKPTSKRPLMKEENMQTLIKKQCTRRQPNKPKPSKSTKDPQSIAAKTRRERISERLKILQDLVPNGSKVDLVTMLEKATSYVKFLQLQVKVLATDEFWPAGGGRLPDITQVREAIDVILSTRRNNDNHNNSNHTTPSNEKEMEDIIDSDN